MQRLKKEASLIFVPQILIGASSSRRLGWLRKTSLEAEQSWRISTSSSFACFAVLPLFVSNSRLIISSTKLSSILSKSPKPLSLKIQTERNTSQSLRRSCLVLSAEKIGEETPIGKTLETFIKLKGGAERSSGPYLVSARVNSSHTHVRTVDQSSRYSSDLINCFQIGSKSSVHP